MTATETTNAKTTAKDVVDYLRDTGTGGSKLRTIEGYAKGNESLSGDELYRWMEREGSKHGIFLGTLRKAGKFLYGDAFEPEQSVLRAPEEEIIRLRLENESIKDQLAAACAAKAGMEKQVQYLREHLADKDRQLQWQKLGQPTE